MASSHSDCIVTGSLSVVLRMSRAMGLAPLSFNKVRGGWSVRVSYVAYAYGILLTTALNVLSVWGIVLDLSLPPEKSLRLSKNSARVIWVAEVSIVATVLTIAALTGLRRMRCLTNSLIQLQKINRKLNVSHESANNKTRTIIVMCFLAAVVIITTVSFFTFCYDNYALDKDVFTAMMYSFREMSNVILEVMLIQFAQIATYMLTSLTALNVHLKKILQELVDNAPDTNWMLSRKENQFKKHNNISYKTINNVIDTIAVNEDTNTSVKSMPSRVRHLYLYYSVIGDVVRQTTDCHGAVLVIILLSILLHLIMTLLNTITTLVHEQKSLPIMLLMGLGLTSIHFCNLLLIVDPCHKTRGEMALTKHLISEMMRHTPAGDDDVLFELKLFFRHVMMNDVAYAPMQMMRLDRSLIVAILGSVATYLVIVIDL